MKQICPLVLRLISAGANSGEQKPALPPLSQKSHTPADNDNGAKAKLK